MLVDELRAVPLFDGLTDAQVAELAAAGTEETFEPGGAPLRRGPAGRRLVGAPRRVASTSCAASATRRR